MKPYSENKEDRKPALFEKKRESICKNTDIKRGITNMKKTKIICTLGPNTSDKELLRALALNGMNIARFNFSHGDYEEHLSRYKLLKEVREETGIEVAALLDTKGPEIRTGLLRDGKKVILTTGSTYTLTVKETIGDDKLGYINYAGLIEDIAAGNRILIDDGIIELEVEEISGDFIICRVLAGGELGERKGVNVPGVSVRLPALTDKDKEDIKFGISHGFDFIAASFVRNANCIKEIRTLLEEYHSNMMIIAKIENAEGIKNIDAIIEEADGIMIARGDLGVEIPAEEVPFIQKTIIKKCNIACKPVITATQMLDSMIRNPRPTRAETTDVANAIYDGTDATMLSGETAIGKYPLEALQMMHRIATESENHLDHKAYRNRRISVLSGKNISNQVGYAAVSTADELEAAAILAPSISGFTTRMLSKWRPAITVYGLSPSLSSVRKMQLYWGVCPIVAKRADSTDDLISGSIEALKKKGYLHKGDLVIITAGVIPEKHEHRPASHTNIMQVETVL